MVTPSDSERASNLPGIGNPGQKKQSYVAPRWVTEGMSVWIQWDRERGAPSPTGTSGLRCQVTIAAGDAARIENNKYQVSEWRRLEDLRVPSDTSYARYGG